MLQDLIDGLWNNLEIQFPLIVGSLIILIIGWIAGHIAGAAVSELLERTKTDKALEETTLGRFIKKRNISFAKISGRFVRWIIYAAAILTAIDLFNLEVLDTFVNTAFTYLPSLMGGLVALILGLIIVDFISDLMTHTGEELKIEFISVFTYALRFMLYFVVIVLSLTIMRVDVEILYIFANALSWGAAIGIGVGLGIAIGWGLKDIFAKRAEQVLTKTIKTLEKADNTIEIDELKVKVEALEKELAERENEVKSLRSFRSELIEDLTKPIDDPYSKLLEIVENKGSITAISSGYNIVVDEPTTFPWFETLFILGQVSSELWISREDGKLVIKNKTDSE